MNWIFHSLDIVWGCLILIGWIAGVIAWARRGFGVPRVVHIAARIFMLVGIALTAALLASGIRSVSFCIFLVLGFPAWAYVGWFICGCPAEDRKKQEGYDISEALGQTKE